jgi:hypothetical protein
MKAAFCDGTGRKIIKVLRSFYERIKKDYPQSTEARDYGTLILLGPIVWPPKADQLWLRLKKTFIGFLIRKNFRMLPAFRFWNSL